MILIFVPSGSTYKCTNRSKIPRLTICTGIFGSRARGSISKIVVMMGESLPEPTQGKKRKNKTNSATTQWNLAKAKKGKGSERVCYPDPAGIKRGCTWEETYSWWSVDQSAVKSASSLDVKRGGWDPSFFFTSNFFHHHRRRLYQLWCRHPENPGLLPVFGVDC